MSCCDREDCACQDTEYQISLTEAAWYSAHPPTTAEERDEASRLETTLSRYCNDHGLGEPWELYELRQLLDK